MKKLLYIANLRLPTEKAYGIQIAKMCEAFAVSGHEVKLFYPHRRNPAISQDIFSYYSVKNNFVVCEIESKDFYFPAFLDKVSFLIKNYFSAKALVNKSLKEGAEVYYTRDERVAYILSKKGKNVVFECHRFSSKKKSFYRHFKKIVAISDGLKEDLVKNGIKDLGILVARDGVDMNLFNADTIKEDARKKMDLPLDKKIIMYTGHLYEWKGASVLLETAHNFHKEEEVLFVFVGGTEYDVKNFREKAEGLKNVLILGHKPYVHIPSFLKSADVLVLPNLANVKISQNYTSPLKLFEYMAAKRPIVASRLPSIEEILNDNNAILVDSNSSEKLADGIRCALSDTTRAEKA